MSYFNFTEKMCLFNCRPSNLFRLVGMGRKNDIVLQGFSQISTTIWLKPICFSPSARPINGTAIDTKNTIL